jgi:hypothetical protein
LSTNKRAQRRPEAMLSISKEKGEGRKETKAAGTVFTRINFIA